jgi:uncharacterized membrane protein YfcA
LEYLTLLVAGALSGLVAGVAGLGGGTVIVPVLTWVYGHAALHDAIVASWFAVLFNSATAVFEQYRVRNDEERAQLVATSKYFLLGVLFATPVVALAVSGAKSALTPAIVGALQLTLAAALVWPRKEAAQPRSMSRRVDTGFGALVGAASAAIGIGGGAYTTAYMLYGPRRGLKDAIAAGNVTGLAVGALSVVGFVASLAIGGSKGPASPISGIGMVLLIAGGAVCSAVGVKLSRKLPTATLKKLLVGFLALSAIRLLFF